MIDQLALESLSGLSQGSLQIFMRGHFDTQFAPNFIPRSGFPKRRSAAPARSSAALEVQNSVNVALKEKFQANFNEHQKYF